MKLDPLRSGGRVVCNRVIWSSYSLADMCVFFSEPLGAANTEDVILLESRPIRSGDFLASGLILSTYLL